MDEARMNTNVNLSIQTITRPKQIGASLKVGIHLKALLSPAPTSAVSTGRRKMSDRLEEIKKFDPMISCNVAGKVWVDKIPKEYWDWLIAKIESLQSQLAAAESDKDFFLML